MCGPNHTIFLGCRGSPENILGYLGSPENIPPTTPLRPHLVTLNFPMTLTPSSSKPVAKSSGAAAVTKMKGAPATTKEVIDLSDDDDEKTKSGVIFTFISDDGQFESFTCTDPIFARVEGHQKNASFLTAEMVDHIKSELAKEFQSDDHSDNVHPLSEEDARCFLYEYTSCMDSCSGGEKATATYVAYNFC